MQSKFKWETLSSTENKSEEMMLMAKFTSRAKVPGGWLVSRENVTIPSWRGQPLNTFSMCFVPDPEHKWEVA